MAVRKWSISIDEDLAHRVEKHVTDRGLSGFVSRAVDHELEREALAEYLDDLDAEYGPTTDDRIRGYDALWP